MYIPVYHANHVHEIEWVLLMLLEASEVGSGKPCFAGPSGHGSCIPLQRAFCRTRCCSSQHVKCVLQCEITNSVRPMSFRILSSFSRPKSPVTYLLEVFQKAPSFIASSQLVGPLWPCSPSMLKVHLILTTKGCSGCQEFNKLRGLLTNSFYHFYLPCHTISIHIGQAS